MAKRKSVTQLSSTALFKLAQQKEQEEMAHLKEAAKEKIEALRVKRRAFIAKHKKDVAKIDSAIKKLGGKSARSAKRSSGNVSAAVLATIADAKKISTQDIKAALKKQGIKANNLGQTLAYLKRQGKITSPSRAVYAAKK